MKRFFFSFIAMLFAFGCLQAQQPCDLLFFKGNSSGMDDAIQQSSGQFVHVAMVESVGDTIWIIDATPQRGVCRRPLFIDYNDKNSTPTLYHIEQSINTHAILERARSFIGQPYDNAFLPDNGAMYCSELIYECYLKEDGSHLFEAKPMNWRNDKGKLPKYWVEHFRRLDMQVPEGVLGTNPNDLSKSKTLSEKDF